MSPELREALGANPIAHLRYAALLSVAEAHAIVESQATDGTWRKHPGEWLEAGRRLAQRKDSPWLANGFYEWVVEVFTSSTLDHDLAQLLFEVVGQLLDRSPNRTDLLDCVVEWFGRHASPGHAPICADLLRWSVYHDSSRGRIPVPFIPLVEWLLTNGAAELRATESPHTPSTAEHSEGLLTNGAAELRATDPRTPPTAKHAELLPILVETVAEHDRAQLLEVALRYVLLARVPDCGWFIERPAGLWPQVEQALERGASESLATDILQRIGQAQAPSRASIWAPFAEPTRFPRVWRALLRGLGDGQFPRAIAEACWKTAFGQPPPPELSPFHDRRALRGALETLHHHVAFLERKDESVPTLAAWAERLLDETIRFFGADWVTEVSLEPVHPFERLLGWHEDITAAVERCLERALAAALPSGPVQLARGIMAHEASGHVPRGLRTRAALAAWVPSDTPTVTPRVSVSLASLEARLVQLLNYPWTECHHGVRMGKLLGARWSIAFEELANDDKIRLEDQRIVLDPGFYRSTLSQPSDPERAMALCVLYFLHELIHLQQGIGDFATVQTVRSTGAEMTLMHLDLGADHAACLLAGTAFPRWDLEWLKDVTGRSLSAFPASTFHTQAARYRKAARLVSVRLDYLARTLGTVSPAELDGGYLFADYGPAGGHLLVLRSASPLSLVKAAPLEPSDANVLWNAADPAGRLDDVDEVLRRALRHGSEGLAHG